ncbi:MAG: nucleotidyltransferase domain-containing protein [Verrucomicrobia bacterium]|nr:nucleotidyltransferase domain-containing protein [Verrucomicrobiota bacterium]
MPKLDLHPTYRQVLLEVLAAHVPDAEVWAYGSRVNGQAHEGSDLDLVVRNPDRLDQPQRRLYALRDALTESDLPILVEVLDWARIPEDMRREIERQHVVVTAPAHAAAR